MLSRTSDDRYGSFLSSTDQLNVEFGLLRWLRVYGGVQFGKLKNASGDKRYAFQGIGGGIKMHLYQWGKLALFQELGYQHLNRPAYDFNASRFTLGHSLEYELAPGLYLNAGQTMGFLTARGIGSVLHEVNVGLTVSPGSIFRKK